MRFIVLGGIKNSSIVQDFGVIGSSLAIRAVTNFTGRKEIKNNPIILTVCFIAETFFWTTFQYIDNKDLNGKQVLLPILGKIVASALPVLIKEINKKEQGPIAKDLIYTSQKIKYATDRLFHASTFIGLYMISPYFAVYEVTNFVYKEVCKHTDWISEKAQGQIKTVVAVVDGYFALFHVKSKLMFGLYVARHIYTTYYVEVADKKHLVLPKYITDLSAEADELPKMIGMEKELKELKQRLTKEGEHCVNIEGREGVGKTRLVQGLMQEMRSEACHRKLKDKNIYSVDVFKMIEESKTLFSFEQKVKRLIAMVKKDKSILLHIKEFYLFCAAANKNEHCHIFEKEIRKGLLAGDITSIIAEKTVNSRDDYLEKLIDNDITCFFDSVQVKEKTYEELQKIIKSKTKKYVFRHGVFFPKKTVAAAINITKEEKIKRIAVILDVLDTSGANLRYDIGIPPSGIKREMLPVVTEDMVRVVQLKRPKPFAPPPGMYN